MSEINMAFFIAIAVAFALYMQIQKITQNIDANEAMNGNKDKNLRQNTPQIAEISDDLTNAYKAFCDDIDIQIRELKQKALYDDMLKDESLKDEFLAELSQASRKLTFIQNMNTKKDASSWESELFEILHGIENSVDKSLKNSDKINYDLREALRESFTRIK